LVHLQEKTGLLRVGNWGYKEEKMELKYKKKPKPEAGIGFFYTWPA
jgi:hypothetical protein